MTIFADIYFMVSERSSTNWWNPREKIISGVRNIWFQMRIHPLCHHHGQIKWIEVVWKKPCPKFYTIFVQIEHWIRKLVSTKQLDANSLTNLQATLMDYKLLQRAWQNCSRQIHLQLNGQSWNIPYLYFWRWEVSLLQSLSESVYNLNIKRTRPSLANGKCYVKNSRQWTKVFTW